VVKPTRPLIADGVDLVVGEVDRVCAADSEVFLVDGRRLAFDVLVIATGGVPGMTAMATHMMRKQIAEVGVPEVPEFLDQIVASGGHLWACRMSADMMHLTKDDLHDDVEGIINAADFIEMSDGAQLLFI
jgi:peroxiredoxin family protein